MTPDATRTTTTLSAPALLRGAMEAAQSMKAEWEDEAIGAMLQEARAFIERSIQDWLEQGKAMQDLAVLIQGREDGAGRVAPVDRERLASIIESEYRSRIPAEDTEQVEEAARIAKELRTRMADRTPIVLNFSAGQHSISRVVWLHFTGGALRFDIR